MLLRTWVLEWRRERRGGGAQPATRWRCCPAKESGSRASGSREGVAGEAGLAGDPPGWAGRAVHMAGLREMGQRALGEL